MEKSVPYFHNVQPNGVRRPIPIHAGPREIVTTPPKGLVKPVAAHPRLPKYSPLTARKGGKRRRRVTRRKRT